MHGPLACGEWPDVKIFSSKMNECLHQDDKVIDDNDYNHINRVALYTVDDGEKAMHSRLHARHETCNERLKAFNTLDCTFRHSIVRHNVVFHAVAELVMLSVQFENFLFSL